MSVTITTTLPPDTTGGVIPGAVGALVTTVATGPPGGPGPQGIEGPPGTGGGTVVGRRVAVLGHSIASAGTVPNAYDGSRAGGCYAVGSFSLLGQALPATAGQFAFGGVYATPGLTATQIHDTLLAGVVASSDQTVVIDPITNSIAKESWSTAKTALIDMRNQIQAAGKTVVFLTGWPLGSVTHTVGTTSGSPVVTDAAISALDQGRAVTGTGIPANSFVGTVIASTSFRISSSATSQVDVNASATGSVTATIGTLTTAQQKMVLSYAEWARRQARITPDVYCADTFRSCVDPFSTVGGWRGGYSADGIHPTPVAIAAVAPELSRVLNDIPGSSVPVLASGYNASAMFADSTLSIGPDATWAFGGGGSRTTMTASSPPQWLGKRWQIVGGATPETLTVQVGTLTAAHRIRLAARIECTVIGTGTPSWSLAVYDSITTTVLCGYTADINLLPDGVVVFEFDIPTGVTGNPYVLNVQAAGTGTTISVAQITVTDLTALDAL